MKTSISALNYLAFLILYITSFVFMYQSYSEILGTIVLFITNSAFMVFAMNDLLPYVSQYSNFVPLVAVFSIITTVVLYTVSLIFVLMMINNMQTKYTKSYGTPMVLPKQYRESFETFKRLSIASFCACSVLLIIIFYRLNYINMVFYESIKRVSLDTLYYNGTAIFTILLSAATLIMSSIDISIANDYSKLTRQNLIV
jgi:hypothetical protein